MIFLITFLTFVVVMFAMALKILLGRSTELRRGCGDDCRCVRPKKIDREHRQ
jgi:hypothetical protein